MKNLILIAALGLAVAIPAKAQLVGTNFSIGTLTNVPASTTTNAPSTAIVTARNYGEVGVKVMFKIAATDATTTRALFNFARETFGTNDYDTSPLQQMVLAVTNNGTSFAHGSTNFYLGSFEKLRLVSIQNQSTQAMSGVVVRAVYKGRREGL